MVAPTPSDRLLLAAALLPLFGSSAFGVKCDATMLLTTMSGPDSSCSASDTNLHHWPLVGDTTHCHGWEATDPNGEVHLNSAANIRCGANNRTMLYDQYPGSLSCAGSPHPKEFGPSCTQGVPARLFDRAINLDCCADPASCLNGVPSVNNLALSNAKIYSDGQLCAAPAAPTPEPGPADVGFNVYTDPDCTVPLIAGRTPTLHTGVACSVDTYVDPEGNSQTNANTDWNCGADFVEWTQYPGSTACPAGDSDARIIHSKLYAGHCVAVMTHMGTTYQKLADGYIQCAARSIRSPSEHGGGTGAGGGAGGAGLSGGKSSGQQGDMASSMDSLLAVGYAALSVLVFALAVIVYYVRRRALATERQACSVDPLDKGILLDLEAVC